uniref:Uncharacterized protein n=1 Tax=Setaria italica TaxID=4555 RepID=K3ZAW2_SETIT
MGVGKHVVAGEVARRGAAGVSGDGADRGQDALRRLVAGGSCSPAQDSPLRPRSSLPPPPPTHASSSRGRRQSAPARRSTTSGHHHWQRALLLPNCSIAFGRERRKWSNGITGER